MSQEVAWKHHQIALQCSFVQLGGSPIWISKDSNLPPTTEMMMALMYKCCIYIYIDTMIHIILCLAQIIQTSEAPIQISKVQIHTYHHGGDADDGDDDGPSLLALIEEEGGPSGHDGWHGGAAELGPVLLVVFEAWRCSKFKFKSEISFENGQNASFFRSNGYERFKVCSSCFEGHSKTWNFKICPKLIRILHQINVPLLPHSMAISACRRFQLSSMTMPHRHTNTP